MSLFGKGTGSRLALIFAVQAVIGTLLFALVAALAVGLNVAAHWLETNLHIDETVLAVLKAGEVAILCVDATLFLLYLLAEAVKFSRELYKLVADSWQ